MNQKGIIGILIPVIIMVIGVAVAVFLSQKTQIFTPRASTLEPPRITDENYEATLNPFGDAWAWKKSPSSSIPAAAAGPIQYINYNDPDKTILERYAQYLAKSNSPYLFMDSYEPQSEGQNPKSIALLSRVKQLNPNIKFLGYLVNHEAPPTYTTIKEKADNGDAAFEAFFVHKKGKPATKEFRLHGRPDHPEWGFVPFMNITNPGYRAYVIPKIVDSINSAKMDGVMSDLLFFNIIDLLNLNHPPASMPDNIIPDEVASAWPGAVLAFHQELKAAMGSNLLLFGNVNDDEPQFMENDLLSPGRLDGVIFEDPFDSRLGGGASSLTKVKKIMDIVEAKGKKSILITTGSENGTTFSNTNPAQEKLVQRYFLAAYLQTFRGPNQSFLYYHPTLSNRQFRSEAFFREWDLNLGSPTAPSQEAGNGVLVRKFERGYVYWNPTNTDFKIPGGSDLYNIDNGQDIRGQIVPARSGAFFVTSSVLQEYNTPPAIIIPSPSPSPQISLTAFTECAGPYPAINLDFTDIGKEYTVEISPSVKGVGINNGAIPGRLTLRPLRIYDAGVNGIRALSPNTTYSLYLLATTGEKSNTVTVTTPANCPLPSPSQLPSKDPIKKIGDIDNDGDIDIFDFNFFVEDFRNNNLRSDLNSSGKVDIFDFNIMVERFGK